MTTNSSTGDRTFRFTIGDLAVFLGKSPVTIRAWERKGLVKLPRVGANRAMNVEDVRSVAGIAYHQGRIREARHALVTEALTTLSLIEEEKK